MSGGRWAAHKPCLRTSSLSGSVIRRNVARPSGLRHSSASVSSGMISSRTNDSHPVELRLELGFGLEIPCHATDCRSIAATAPHPDVTSDPCLVVAARTEYPCASHVDSPPTTSRPGRRRDEPTWDVLPASPSRSRPALHALRPVGLHRLPRAGERREPLRRVRQGGQARRQDPRQVLERASADARHVHDHGHQRVGVPLRRGARSREHPQPQHHQGSARARPLGRHHQPRDRRTSSATAASTPPSPASGTAS